jgi:hypothetical protein
MFRFICLFCMLGLSAPALAIDQPPSAAPDLRNGYASLNAVPGVPDGFKVDFTDDAVLLRSVTVQPTGTPEEGSCRVKVLINNLLVKVMIVEPPTTIVGITQPPSTIPALTWEALLGRAGYVQPPTAIVFTPQDGLTVILENEATDSKAGACSANVLVLGSVLTEATEGQVTPISPDQLRSRFVSLEATPDAPGDETLSFSDAQVLVRSMDVLSTQQSSAGDCVVQARIDELLARIQISQPPGQIVGIVEPPDGIVGLDGVTLAGINEPPDAIIFTPNDTLKVELHSVPTGKEKDKDNTCAADVLILGTTPSEQ